MFVTNSVQTLVKAKLISSQLEMLTKADTDPKQTIKLLTVPKFKPQPLSLKGGTLPLLP